MKKDFLFSLLFLFFLLSFSPSHVFASDGTPDTSFVTGTGFTNASDVRVIARQPDGKLFIGGAFTSYEGTTINRIIRLNADGSPDDTFSIGAGISGGATPAVYSALLQPDGKILIGGSFNSYGAASSTMLVRLNADGSLDNTFTSLFSGISNVLAFARQPDGKIIVAGNFSAYDGTSANRIVRINADGTRDNTFTMGTGFNSTSVDALALQSDGKVIVGGNFTAYNSTPVSNIVRLNTDGSIDSTFNPSGAGFSGTVLNGIVRTLTLDDQGRIIVGGDFTSYNGTPVDRIVRLNTDGSIDGTFVPPGTGFDATSVRTIAIGNDGKIILGGTFLSYNGVTANRIISLNADGSPDAAFDSGSGFNNTVSVLAVDPDDTVLAGGLFTSYNGTTTNAIARLGFSPPSITFSADPTAAAYNGTTELTWDATGQVDSCTASGDWSGSKDASGTVAIENLTEGKTFTLTCTGPGGTSEEDASVTVAPEPAPQPVSYYGGGGGGGRITVPAIATTTPASATTSTSTQAALFQELNSLMTQFDTMLVATLTRDLTIGSQGQDVEDLQFFLDENGDPVASTGPGSLGDLSTYFGPMTEHALARWQTADGLPATGYLGPLTRAMLEKKY